MTTLFDVLPGTAMPVAEVTKTLSRMWEEDTPSGDGPAADFRASQLNLVLHFGLATPPDEALGVFQQALKFAQIYPCRIVVLCPLKDTRPDLFLQGKLFAQCYIGRNTRQQCCCEALILGYPVSSLGYLESQVGNWLENDLPVYHWLHRVSAHRLEESYLSYLKTGTRVVYDSCVEGPDYAQVRWPRPEVAMDLAYARLLPVRQSLGQFLSGYAPALLVRDLRRVECRYAPESAGEAAGLLRWQRRCLEQCAKLAGASFDEVACDTHPLTAATEGLVVEWQYDGGEKYFRWSHDQTGDTARLAANFGAGPVELPQLIKPMPFERVLAEALFF